MTDSKAVAGQNVLFPLIIFIKIKLFESINIGNYI